VTSRAHPKGRTLDQILGAPWWRPDDADDPEGQGPELLEGTARERRARRRAEQQRPRQEAEQESAAPGGSAKGAATSPQTAQPLVLCYLCIFAKVLNGINT
jgi:hypothetical protein